jgi:hypothetical protein
MKWILPFVVVSMLASVCSAQTAVTVDTGRMFSVSAGSFVTGSSTSLDYGKGPLTLTGTIYVSSQGVFEKDLSAAWTLKETSKWTVSSYVGTYWYTGIGRDWSWSVSVRRVIR